MLGDILAYLGLAGDGAAQYGKSLEAFIDETKSADDLKTVISGVLSETRTVMEVNKALEKRLDDSSRHVTELKENLEDLRREATIDALTGIANRKCFDQVLRRAAARAMEEGTDLSLLIIDIDHFKKFNDTYGHQVGDHVLRLLGATLSSSTKGKDTPAPYGGEEFCVILPDTGLGNAVKVAEGIRHALGDKVLTNRKTGKDMGRISVSIGVAIFELGEPLSQLISRADRALYLGKNNGRNRVVSQDQMKDLELVFDS
jgi:diguanylate cyclase